MKPLLLVFLAASLAANVVLGLLARRSAQEAAGLVPATDGSPASGTTLHPRSSGGGVLSPVSSARTAGSGTATGAATVAPRWPATQSDEDLHRIVADMRAAGYPPGIVRAVVNHLLNERFAALQPDAGLPFWKLSAPSEEVTAARNALANQRRALFEALLGPDALPSATLDALNRERRYGNLSDDKINAISRIERDYSEMTAEAWAKRRGNIAISTDSMMQTQRLMEEEKLADLATILTPDELAAYERRNSSSARTLINGLHNVEVTETEFARLFEAQKSFETAHTIRGTMDSQTFVARQAGQRVLNEQARAILGDDRFYPYIEGADRNYAQVAQAFTAYPTVTPNVAYQVYELQQDLQAVMIRNPNDGPPSQERIAEMRTLVESANARLESLVGAEAAEAYRKQGSGRMFTSFRQAPPRPTTSRP